MSNHEKPIRLIDVLKGGNRVRLRKLACCLMALALVLQLGVVTPSYAAPEKFKDVNGHWAAKYINTAVSKNFASGYPDGTFLPDKAVTRAEFAAMVNKALGNQAEANLSFSDVPKSEWYYKDVAKAVAAGYTGGYDDNTFRPNSKISRQEAAVMLSRIVPASGENGSLDAYSDNENIAEWAYQSMEKVNGKGYIGAYNDGQIHPSDPLTRAQTAKIIGDLLEKEKVVTSDTMIDKDKTELSDVICTNNVTVDEDVDDESVSIENCTVLGTLFVRGGENTVTVSDSRIADVFVDKDGDPVRILAKGETAIAKLHAKQAFYLQTSSLSGGLFGSGFNNIVIEGSSKGTLKGSFSKVYITGPKAELNLSSGTIDELVVDGKSSNITAGSDSLISKAIVNVESYFLGNGTVAKMDVNAKGVTYETKPDKWDISSSADTPSKAGQDDDEIEFSPEDRDTRVKVDTEITINFDSAIEEYDGSSVSDFDIEELVELRKGSSSGSEVAFTASINRAKTEITIFPEKDLSTDTKYYVIIPKNSFKLNNGSGNDAQSIYFTTGEGSDDLDVVFSPKNGAATVSVNTDIIVTFSEGVVKSSNGGTISSNDTFLNDCIVLKKGSSSGSSVPFIASINSTKKVITIKPKSSLTLNQKYYVAVVGNKLKGKVSDDILKTTSALWTTGNVTPSLTSVTVTPGDTSATVTAVPSVAGKLYAVVLKSGSTAPSVEQIAAGQGSNGLPALAFAKNENVSASTVTLPIMNGLGSGVSYDVYCVLYSTSNGTYTAPIKTTIKTTLPTVSLKGFTVSPIVDGSTQESVISLIAGTQSYAAAFNSSVTSVEVKAQCDSDAVITLTGAKAENVSINGDLVATVDITQNPTLTIKVSRTGSTDSIYTITLRNSNDTNISSLKINGVSQTPSGSSYTYTLSSAATDVTLNVLASDKYAMFTNPTGTNVSIVEAVNELGVATFKLSLPAGSEPVAAEFDVISGSSVKPYYILFTRQ